jgi:hypothetical protein
MKICHANGTAAPTDVQEMPGSLRNIANATIADFVADGWLVYEPSGLPNIKSSTWRDDGWAYRQIDVVQFTAEELAAQEAQRQAEAAAARLASFAPFATKAVLFRATLRKHFGPTAETDRAVTATSVAEYFMGKQVAGTITTQELADAIVLDKLFAELAAWNGTGETWTLPYEVLPS